MKSRAYFASLGVNSFLRLRIFPFVISAILLFSEIPVKTYFFIPINLDVNPSLSQKSSVPFQFVQFPKIQWELLFQRFDDLANEGTNRFVSRKLMSGVFVLIDQHSRVSKKEFSIGSVQSTIAQLLKNKNVRRSALRF